MCHYGSQCFHSVFMNEGKCHSSALSIQSVKKEHEVALSYPTQRSGDTCWYFVLFWVNHLTPFVNKIYALFMSFLHLRNELCIGCVSNSNTSYSVIALYRIIFNQHKQSNSHGTVILWICFDKKTVLIRNELLF